LAAFRSGSAGISRRLEFPNHRRLGQLWLHAAQKKRASQDLFPSILKGLIFAALIDFVLSLLSILTSEA